MFSVWGSSVAPSCGRAQSSLRVRVVCVRVLVLRCVGSLVGSARNLHCVPRSTHWHVQLEMCAQSHAYWRVVFENTRRQLLLGNQSRNRGAIPTRTAGSLQRAHCSHRMWQRSSCASNDDKATCPTPRFETACVKLVYRIQADSSAVLLRQHLASLAACSRKAHGTSLPGVVRS